MSTCLVSSRIRDEPGGGARAGLVRRGRCRPSRCRNKASGGERCPVGPLDVVPGQVADTAHGRATDGGVVPMMVVAVEPGGQGPGSLTV
jgi:hypothetical protein